MRQSRRLRTRACVVSFMLAKWAQKNGLRQNPKYVIKSGAFVYDSALYELAVLDTGDFDINVPGAYEVTYSLTPITETPEGEDPAEDMDDSDALDPDVDGADQDGDTADQPDTGNNGDTTTGADNGTGNANSGDTTVNSGNAAAESDAGASMTTGDATHRQKRRRQKSSQKS